jgi:hypothetical protein
MIVLEYGFHSFAALLFAIAKTVFLADVFDYGLRLGFRRICTGSTLLKEQPGPELVQIVGITPAPATEEWEEVGSETRFARFAYDPQRLLRSDVQFSTTVSGDCGPPASGFDALAVNRKRLPFVVTSQVKPA